jgi:hypothetical protein
MNVALNRFQCLVSIWSFECLEALRMSTDSNNSENEVEQENESE